MKATRLAEEPLFTVSTWRTPRYSARRFSNRSLKRPVVSQPSRAASTMCLSSEAPSTLPAGGTAVTPGWKGTGA